MSSHMMPGVQYQASPGFRRALAQLLTQPGFVDAIKANPEGALASFGLQPHEKEAITRIDSESLKNMVLTTTAPTGSKPTISGSISVKIG